MSPLPETLTTGDLIPGDLLLTVNNRLAAELHRQYDRREAAAGRQVWPTPRILPWRAWLQSQYQVLLDGGHCEADLLTPLQERTLWQEVIASDTQHNPLLQVSAAARSAQEAYERLLEWGLDAQPLAEYGGSDTAHFLAWRERFDADLARRGLMVAAGLTPLLGRAFADGTLPHPSRLLLAGFETLSPAQQDLLETLTSRGCEVVLAAAHGAATAAVSRVVASDPEDEVLRAAHWARERLQVAGGLRIGIVCTQLQQRRDAIERVFTRVFAPAAYLTGEQGARPFNLSLGEPLARRRLSAHALLTLRLLDGALDLDDIGVLLRSPFVGAAAAEWEARALFDTVLRRDGRPRLDLAQLRRQLQRTDADAVFHCPDLARRCDDLAALAGGWSRRATAAAWTDRLQDALRRAGWPGDRPLDSHEYQAFEKTGEAFRVLAGMDKLGRRLDLGDAIAQLAEILAETVFQPQSGDAPIQVLGPLEAAGIGFDATWLLGADDTAWPPPAAPNPLLPASLQRRLDMPHASAARELAFAQAVTAGLAANTAELVASHAARDGDREQRASPLTAGWPLAADPDARHPPDPLIAACAGPPPREPYPVTTRVRPPATISGGTALLDAQANCPFRAIAVHRLRARPLDEATHVPDAALLGNLVHELLQRVWKVLGDSAGLAALDGGPLADLVRPLAGEVLADQARRRPDLYTPGFVTLEQARLTRLAVDWLAIERARARPFRIEALELDAPVTLGDLALQTRVDRIDRLDDGSLAVIDYKTGRQVGCDGWFDPRLTEPQLPLYCIAGGRDVGAALLARVRADEKGYRLTGVSRDSGFADGVQGLDGSDGGMAWDALLGTWRGALDTLAGEITAGRADATPSPRACEYCPAGDLCRVRDDLPGDNDA
jgi:ATP-dependent helicase/nuclease subunit B